MWQMNTIQTFMYPRHGKGNPLRQWKTLRVLQASVNTKDIIMNMLRLPRAPDKPFRGHLGATMDAAGDSLYS